MIGIVVGLFVLLVIAAIVAAIMAPVLMLFARLIADREPDFVEAFKAMFFATIVGAAGNLIWGLATEGSTGEGGSTLLAALVPIAISLAVLTFMIMAILEANFVRALLTSIAGSIVQAVISVILVVLIGVSYL